MKPQQGRTARCILWALGFPLALWLAAALADAFFRRRIPVQGARPFLRLHERPVLGPLDRGYGAFSASGGAAVSGGGPWPWNPGAATAVRAKNTAAPGGETRGPYGKKATGTGGTGRKIILLTQHVALGPGMGASQNAIPTSSSSAAPERARHGTFCLPNVMNACCSYIITDCKGENFARRGRAA